MGEKFVICYGMFEFQLREQMMKTVGFYLETSAEEFYKVKKINPKI